jgi:hypothetical protein
MIYIYYIYIYYNTIQVNFLMSPWKKRGYVGKHSRSCTTIEFEVPTNGTSGLPILWSFLSRGA